MSHDYVKNFIRMSLLVLAMVVWDSDAHSGELQVSWTDNSVNEDGFKIERKNGTSGTYAQIAIVGANLTSYNDSGLADGSVYCYRVSAFNSDSASPYSNEGCASARSTVQTFTLSVATAGTGSGTVTSAPVGINCGADCSESYNSGTTVSLTATPASGSVFAGWSGTGCSTTGSVTMNANRTCTATFNLQPVTTYTLTVAKAGTGSGTVTSIDGGINCGSTCSKVYNSGASVTLNAAPATGSVFAGWSGTGCSTTGSVTMNANRTCTATFNLQPVTTYTLTVAKGGTGSGTVTSTDGGINCGSTCSKVYNSGTSVTLTATPATGSVFAGWSGCCFNKSGSITVDLTDSATITATFLPEPPPVTPEFKPRTRIGLFRPNTGQWFLDYNGNGQWDDNTDIHIPSFGQEGDLPVVGDWSGNGATNIGVFNPAAGAWHLDTNRDGILNCAVDTCFSAFGEPGDLPVTREVNGSSGSIIGTYSPQTTVTINGRKRIKRGMWRFDVNGNNKFDGCAIDDCDTFGTVGELPIVGDWNGTGTEEIGLFVPKYGKWFLDTNGNGFWNGCRREKCLGSFGTKGDLPVVGDWDGTGSIRIGVFRPSTGMWYLDMDGNGKLDSCSVDACLGPFGHPGDLPVVGKW